MASDNGEHVDACHPSRSGAATASVGERLVTIFELLLDAYGPQNWWPGSGGFETVVGAILTQSTAWANVERALHNLRVAEALEPSAMLALSEAELEALVRPSGFFRVKGRKLRAFVSMLAADFGGSLERLFALPAEDLRARLLATYGIGPETADDIVLYAAGKPSFVIDAYTRRVFARLGITPQPDRYEAWRAFFMDALPAAVALYNEYHALIDRHARETCRAQPLCEGCVLRAICPTGQARAIPAARVAYGHGAG